MVAANTGDAPAYGNDAITRRARALVTREFGPDGDSAFMLTGTGANVVALACLLRPHEGLIAADGAHANVDEAGAPERFLGSKLFSLPAVDGKLTPEVIDAVDWRRGDVHRVEPRVVTISQPTEYGTCYSLEELHELTAFAHESGMLVHMDGARLSNAAASLGCSLAATSTAAGVDALSFGGTKNGLLAAEVVVVPGAEHAAALRRLRKQAMQLASKLRFVSAQFEALLTDELWRRNASNANAMAARLAEHMRRFAGVELTRPVQANAVFAVLPSSARERLAERHDFDVWDARRGEVRFMASWDTESADVDAFAEDLAAALGSPGFS